jgi:CTP:molybdopterin cytidylyltransferase MocA
MTRTLIVPAAGMGTRLGAGLPKWRVPVAGRPMIDHVLDRHRTYCQRVVLVVSPASRDEAEKHLEVRSTAGRVAVQDAATGMLDAIVIGAAAALESRPDRLWISWCDQIAISASTAGRLAALDGVRGAPAVVMPTVRQSSPYIHFDRDAAGHFSAVRQRREGDVMPESGESDAGLFSLSAEAARWLPEFAADVPGGAGTGERNFLPFLVWAAARAQVATFPIDAIEAVGVNTPEDLDRVERHLRSTDRDRG